MLGFGAIGEYAIGEVPHDFEASFDLTTNGAGSSIIQTASLFERALIQRLQACPEDLRTMNRRRFEHLIAELFNGFGYEVELTKQTRDGGKDIIAVKRAELDLRFLIECKRPDPGNPIGVSTVRELYGVKVDDGATKAILATTTHFTADAAAFSERNKWELELRDYDAIREWIAKYLGKQ
jgi:HJR/Mrr/RecB family endonuclease